MFNDMVRAARAWWDAWRAERHAARHRARIRFLGDVQRLQLKDGDVLVLSVEGNITDDTEKRLVDTFNSKFPGVKAIVLREGMRIGLLNIDREPKE